MLFHISLNKVEPAPGKIEAVKGPWVNTWQCLRVTSEPAVVEVFPFLSFSSLLEQRELILLHLHPTLT